ncbi:MAG TPA: ABC transporter permease [Gammaproteobacteria bacterium]|jgi:ABC-2 type transport system permease protein
MSETHETSYLEFIPDVSTAAAGLLRVNLIGLATIVRKEVRRVVRIWVQTIIPPAITVTLYFIIFGSLVGARVGEMDGVPYMTFIAPGLIMMSVITNSFGNVVSSFFSGKLQLHLEEMLVAPLSYSTIIVGYMIGGVARGALVAALVTAVALFFTDLDIRHPFITFGVILLTAMIFSLGGMLNALFAKNFDDISIIPTFVLTPLTYLGGVFFSISDLPAIWQGVALANPILYMVNAFRYGILGTSDVSLTVAFTIIVGSFVALFALVSILLHRGTGIRA